MLSVTSFDHMSENSDPSGEWTNLAWDRLEGLSRALDDLEMGNSFASSTVEGG